MDTTMTVNGTAYQVLALLGHGKGGYSYLVERNAREYVLKQIHHEPCSYYTFGNKIESEYNDYHRLLKAGIRIPRMLDVDWEQERILKEYIPGSTVYSLVMADAVKPEYIRQVRDMAWLAGENGLNIDYFPTNFIVCNEELFYIDYECNSYMDRWNFDNWGILYWSKTPEFLDYVKTHK